MRKVLFLISDLGYRFSARQLTLLATHLPTGAVDVSVAVLGGHAPWVDMLRRSGVTVEVLGWGRPIDARPFLALRNLVRSLRADTIHVWDLLALRALLFTGGCRGAKLVVSCGLQHGRLPCCPDQLLLRRADVVLALGKHESTLYRGAGIRADRITVGVPAISAELESTTVGEPSAPDVASQLALPSGAHVLLGIGPITWLKGFRDAVWVFDIVNHFRDVFRLVLVGAAPEGWKVARFARAIGVRNSVHFVGPVDDLGPWLNRADLVYVPSWIGGGVGSALAAMAAGRPVIASNVPGLAEVVADGETGLLVPASDKAAAARHTLRLFKDPELAKRLGEAGRRRAEEVFCPQQLVKTCRALYD